MQRQQQYNEAIFVLFLLIIEMTNQAYLSKLFQFPYSRHCKHTWSYPWCPCMSRCHRNRRSWQYIRQYLRQAKLSCKKKKNKGKRNGWQRFFFRSCLSFSETLGTFRLMSRQSALHLYFPFTFPFNFSLQKKEKERKGRGNWLVLSEVFFSSIQCLGVENSAVRASASSCTEGWVKVKIAQFLLWVKLLLSSSCKYNGDRVPFTLILTSKAMRKTNTNLIIKYMRH